MKKILSLAAVALLMSGCAVYGDGYYDNAPRKKGASTWLPTRPSQKG